MLLKSGVGFSDIEKGVSTGAGYCALKVPVSRKKINRIENRSTIGVMSIKGCFVGNLIFGIFLIFILTKR